MNGEPHRLRDRPAGLLTRHFFHALFDFGVFTQEGADAFARALIGVSAAIVSLGLLLVYMYTRKYVALCGAPSGVPYSEALLADTTLAIAMPMWVVATVTVLVSQSLFPDETDYRVLMPLPIGRGIVFGAKLAALALFAGLFTLTGSVALTPMMLRVAVCRWAVDSPLAAVTAFWIVSSVACAFAVVAIIGGTGLLITCTPRAHVRAATAALRTGMLGALVLALPFVMALPRESVRLARHSTWMFLVPPAWFMGVDRVIVGHRDTYFVQLAQMAGAAFVIAVAVALGSYAILYGRFDRVMLHSLAVSRRRALRRSGVADPARAAVREFTAATLGRSALHQGAIVGLAACGIALATNAIVRSDLVAWLQGFPVRQRGVFETVAWIPFPLIVVLGMAARTSLALPIEPKANWVFRLSERDGIRAEQLEAAERVIVRFAVWIPIVLTLPIQWLVAGPNALLAAAMTAVFGLLWTEVLLRDWRRIPFTCSYIPGKHTVAQSFIAGLFIFVVVAAAGGMMEAVTLRQPTRAVAIVMFVLAAICWLVRRRRRKLWQWLPLVFDDELPTDVQVFQLSDH